MRLRTVCSLSLILIAVPCSFADAGGITDKENLRLHQALQPFVVPPDLSHVELSSDAPEAPAP
jgi:hypothetical protein